MRERADYRITYRRRVAGDQWVELRKITASLGAVESLRRKLARRGEQVVKIERREVGPWQPYEQASR